MDVNSIMAFGFPALIIVVGLVEFSKKLGAQGNLCVVLAVVYAVVLMLLVQVAVVFPAIEPWLKTILTGIAVGLAASGIYDLAMKLKQP
jgi:uncharacterized membrane protein